MKLSTPVFKFFLFIILFSLPKTLQFNKHCKGDREPKLGNGKNRFRVDTQYSMCERLQLPLQDDVLP